MNPYGRIARRKLLVGTVAAAIPVIAPRMRSRRESAARFSPLPTGIEIRDFRLFPTDGVMRFIVEIVNTTEEAFDTPSLGVILPHLIDRENYGWANPILEIIHPHSSAGLIGVAPAGLDDDNGWGSPEWIVCDEVSAWRAEFVAGWRLSYSHSIDVRAPDDVLVDLFVTNQSGPLPYELTIMGLVRDQDNRICGSTYPVSLRGVEPGATKVLPLRIGSTVDYVANPFTLLKDAKDITIDFSIQRWPQAVQPGCAPVMPWNR